MVHCIWLMFFCRRNCVSSSFSLTGVSTIACIIALGALLYYKLWHKFIYRLVLYKLLSQTGTSLAQLSFFSLWIIKKTTTQDVNPDSVIIAFSSFSIGGIVFAIMIAVQKEKILYHCCPQLEFTHLCLLNHHISIAIMAIMLE